LLAVISSLMAALFSSTSHVRLSRDTSTVCNSICVFWLSTSVPYGDLAYIGQHTTGNVSFDIL
jgi:hypothetical protein